MGAFLSSPFTGAYVRRFGGSAYLPRRMIIDDLKGGTLHLVDGSPEFRRAVHLVTRAGVPEAMDLMPSGG